MELAEAGRHSLVRQGGRACGGNRAQSEQSKQSGVRDREGRAGRWARSQASCEASDSLLHAPPYVHAPLGSVTYLVDVAKAPMDTFRIVHEEVFARGEGAWRCEVDFPDREIRPHRPASKGGAGRRGFVEV